MSDNTQSKPKGNTVVKDNTGLQMTFNENKPFHKDRKYAFYAVYDEKSRLAGEVRVDSRVSWDQLVAYYHDNKTQFGRKRRIEIISNLVPSYDTMFILAAAIEDYIGLP